MKRDYLNIGGKNWHHKSVVRLAEEFGPNRPPEEIIIERAGELVRRGIQAGWAGPPFDPARLADIMGIRRVEAQAIEAEAQLVPKGEQFELQFRRDVSDKRLNFTFSHEIAHTLFPDCGEMIRQRNSNRRGFDPEREVEYLCDIGAAEILMPSPHFDHDLKSLGISVESADILSERYLASREAIIRRVPSTNLIPCAVVYLHLGFKKDEIAAMDSLEIPFEKQYLTPISPKLRITRVFPSKDFGVFLPRNKSVPDNSILYGLTKGKESVSGEEKWEIPGFGTRKIEAVRLYNFQKTGVVRVIALVY